MELGFGVIFERIVARCCCTLMSRVVDAKTPGIEGAAAAAAGG